jgi:hypothetical protein
MFPNLFKPLKVESQVENSKCVPWFHGIRCTIAVQRRFHHTVFRKEPPTKCKLFVETGCICKGKSHGRQPVTENKVDEFKTTFVRSPRK